LEILIFTGSHDRQRSWERRLQNTSFVQFFRVYRDLSLFQQELSRLKEATVIVDLLYPFEKEEVRPARLSRQGREKLIDLFNEKIAEVHPAPRGLRVGFVLLKFLLDNLNAHQTNFVIQAELLPPSTGMATAR
jgi:hypothetical protein